MATGVAAGGVTFGTLLRQLRRRVGLTQGELAVLVGFSVAQISRLEKDERLPDPQMVVEQFLPALLLEEEPRLAQQLVTLAAHARGERPPTYLTTRQTVHTVIQEEVIEHAAYPPGLPLPLVGRDQDLEIICKRLMAVPGRLLTLVGPPGVGKTQLALACAAQVQHLFADGVYFIALAAVTEADFVPAAIAAGMDLAEHEHKAPRRRLLETLRRKAVLLVLDNFEQVGAAAGLVAELVANCARLHVLVTSQEPLRLRAEQRQRIQPLAPAAAVELFLQRAQAIDPEFVLDAKTTEAVTAICLRLDCLPLAIELMAGQLERFAPHQILARLGDQGLDLLIDGPRDLADHHRTLRTAIQRSYALLQPTEQQLLRLLSVFPGGCTLAGLKAVASEIGLQLTDRAEVQLRSLVRKSLVQQQTGEQERFMLLTTIRAYAQEELSRNSEAVAVHHAHVNYCLQLAQQRRREATAGADTDKPRLELIAQEYDNLRAALDWSLAMAPSLALEMVVALGEFWTIRGYDFEARRWLAQTLASNPERTQRRAAALVTAADFARRQADYQEAELLIAEAIQIYETVPNHSGLAYALRQAGWLAYDLHNQCRTLDLFQRSLTLYRELADPAGVADLLICLAHLLPGQPEHRADVQAYLAESLTLNQQLNRSEGIAQVLQEQAELEMADGNYAAAQQKFAEALQLWRTLDAKREVGWAVALVGEAAWLQNDLKTAEQCYREAYELFVKLGNKDGIAILRHHLAQVARRQGQLAQATTSYLESLTLSWELENQHMVARALVGLGGVALAAGATKQAATLFGVACTILDQLSPFLAPADADELAEMINATRADLGAVAFEQNWQLGQAMNQEEVRLILLEFPSTETGNENVKGT